MRRLCLSLLLGWLSLAYWAPLAAANDTRTAPAVSHAQVMQWYRGGDYSRAFAAALHRYEWGDENLHLPLGLMYAEGLGTAVNHRLARQHLQVAAGQGDVEAIYRLALMDKLGEAGPSDRRRACEGFQAAARRQHLNATFEYARCLYDGLGAGRDVQQAMQHFHWAAARQHRLALRALQFNHDRHGPQDLRPHASYTQSEQLLLDGQPRQALRAAISAIDQGDYRGYASLAEALRRTGSDPELIQQMRAIGEQYGSPISAFSQAEEWRAAGDHARACPRYLVAIERGLGQAGLQAAACVRGGHLPARNVEAEACAHLETASQHGQAAARVGWAACLARRSADPALRLQAITSYLQGIEAAPNEADPGLAQALCEGLEQRHIPAANPVSMGGTVPATDEPVCVVSRAARYWTVFAPRRAWLGKVSPAALNLELRIQGLRLDDLNRARLRQTMAADAQAASLGSDDRQDRWALNTAPPSEMLARYDAAGRVRSLTLSREDSADGEAFRARMSSLAEQLGEAHTQSNSAAYTAAHWQVAGWKILIMRDGITRKLTESYTLLTNP